MHLVRDRRSALDDILSKHVLLPVIRAEYGMVLQAGKIYLIVENTTLTVEDGLLKVKERDSLPINSSVNILFNSLADDFREKAIVIILSGGGDDGLKGAEKIEEMGGMVLVQDPFSAEVTGMPYSVIRGNHAAAILKPAALARLINNLV
ncbi:two-component system, chemotaxis family, CheB/CheR fusion protein [Pedobacter hartonius]|uniref:protein-glutamate methylesterase n=1 Tax=Pedobacter hartonius TaxID=425514 RepID=A0A1H3W3D8_9SPHI|nr:two-component system, chemotaxis family, CheB/CheR fusion protein [Pedobacter hartonius]